MKTNNENLNQIYKEDNGLDLNLSDWKIWAQNRDYIELKDVRDFELDGIFIQNIPTLIMLKTTSCVIKTATVTGVSGDKLSWTEVDISNYGLSNSEICAILGGNGTFTRNPNIKLKLFNPDVHSYMDGQLVNGGDCQRICIYGVVDGDVMATIRPFLEIASQLKFETPVIKNKDFYVNGIKFSYPSIITETSRDIIISPVFTLYCFDENGVIYKTYNLRHICG